jgi:hypothetical protein
VSRTHRRAVRRPSVRPERVDRARGPDRPDATHPKLGIATKPRARHAAVALPDATSARARREGKAPVVVLATEGAGRGAGA